MKNFEELKEKFENRSIETSEYDQEITSTFNQIKDYISNDSIALKLYDEYKEIFGTIFTSIFN